MDSFLTHHTYLAHSHAWWTVHAGILFLIYLGAALFALWLMGVLISAHVTARQPKRCNYRVGGSL